MNAFQDERAPEGAETEANRAGLSRSMLIVLIVAGVLLFSVGLIPVDWATPSQGVALAQTIPTRTPAPIAMTLAVTLQRPNSPPPSAPWAVPVRLAFYPLGDPVTVAGQWDVTLDQSGQWSGGLNLAPGPYDMRAKNLHTLRNVKRNVAVAPNSVVDMGTLREGDADGDNRVRASDFTILRAAYFTNYDDARYDGRADFDEDRRIRSSDFALLRSNYFASGDIEVLAVGKEAPAAQIQGLVALALEPAQVIIRPGDLFTLTLQAHAGAQEFAAMDAEIRFNPTELQVVGPDGLPASAIEPLPGLAGFYNVVDNAQGKISYGAGNLQGNTVSGDVGLARMRFKVLRWTTTTLISMPDATVSDATGKFVTGPLSGTVAAAPGPVWTTYLPIILKGP